MRRRAILLAAFAAACGIDAVGQLASDAPPDRRDEDDAEASAPTAIDASDGSDDAIADAATDDGGDAEAGMHCEAGGVTFVDAFGALDGGSWFRVADGSNVPYPQIDMTTDGLGASLVNPAATSSLGALWLPVQVPLHAFDVSFRYVMPCEAGATCSDGLAVAWLEGTDAGQPALSGYIVAKASFALPQLLRGGGVAFDVHQDAVTGDPVTPDLSLLALDGSVPGQYDWHAKTSSRPNMAGTHAVTMRLRKGIMEVTLDGAVVQSGPVVSGFTGWFGFGASSGDTVGTFVVRAFAGTFYPCDDP